MNYLPNKLNKLRKHYNYSQSYVAGKLSIDVVEYMDYENGNAMISYAQMKKLSNLYHISMEEMFINDDKLDLPNISNTNTDEINAKYFMPENNLYNKIKGFVINHVIVTSIIGILVLAIIILSIVLSRAVKPYTIVRENINRLSVSDTTVIYIEDSGAIGLKGLNASGQLNDLAIADATKVCEGDNFSVVLNKHGEVFSSGLNSKYEDEVSAWKNIVDIAAKGNHVIAVDSNGRVYCAGDDEACEIEGTKNIKKVFSTKNAAIAIGNNGNIIYKGSLTGSSYLKDYTNIIDISNSDNILAILKSDRTINVFAKTGSYLKAETWSDIVDVACGDDFVAGLDSFGKVSIEINSDEISDEVKSWSNIIAIAAGKDYLIAFDGKNIYGVGNNKYQQFIKENKEKITLEKVSNISYDILADEVVINFEGVDNASAYLVDINVGTGLSKRTEGATTVKFSTENMIEGKTYRIGIIAIGENDYRDSDVASETFVYNKPDEQVEINLKQFIGKPRSELDEYLKANNINCEAVQVNENCEGEIETIIGIGGIADGTYSRSDVDSRNIEYTYCKVVYTNE